MPGTTTVARTNNQDVDGLLSGIRWNTTALSFGFPTAASAYGTAYGSGEPESNFAPLTSTMQSSARTALGMYQSVSNLVFTESTSTSADLRFARSDKPGTAWAYYPHSSASGGDVWFRNSGNTYANPAPGNYAWHTMLHEIGHALGLAHGQEGGDWGPMTAARDSMEFSVMTYRSYVGAPLTGYRNETWGYAQTPMTYDIAAIQQMYGANYATRSGNTAYRWSPTTGEMSVDGVGQGAPGGNRLLMTVWDGGGTDTYDFSAYATAAQIELRPGEWSTSSQIQRANLGGGNMARGTIANALLFNGDTRSLIENAIGGSGNDTITGNEAGNVIEGRDGDDTLTGLGGNDRLDGGHGVDTAVYGFARALATVTSVNGQVTLSGSEGTDRLIAIERVRFTDGTFNLSSLVSTAAPETVVWRHPEGGVHAWQVIGTQVVEQGGLGTMHPSWHIQDVADFGGDGQADILWRHEGGGIYLWQVANGLAATPSSVGVLDPSWRVQGTGDVGGDGRADIVFRHDGGGLLLWQMNGSQVQSQTSLGALDPSWRLAEMGDFNGDRREDLLFRHDAGGLMVWEMNGGQITRQVALPTLNPSWDVADVVDVNGDGVDDVLFHHDAGGVLLWQVRDSAVVGQTDLGVMDPSWRISNHYPDLL